MNENKQAEANTMTDPSVGSGDLLAALGGSMCVSGEVLRGKRALDYLERMHPVDRGSLVEDLRSLKTPK